jgi:hypothetical protein
MAESTNPVLRFPKRGRPPLADERLADCLVLDEMRERRLQHRVGFRYEDRRFGTQDQLARYLARQHHPPVCVGTIWNWLRRFDAAMREHRDPLSALCDRRRSDANRSRFFSRHPEAAAYVHRRAAVKGTNARKIHRELCRDWRALNRDGNPPSYATTLEFIKGLRRECLAARRAKRSA